MRNFKIDLTAAVSPSLAATWHLIGLYIFAPGPVGRGGYIEGWSLKKHPGEVLQKTPWRVLRKNRPGEVLRKNALGSTSEKNRLESTSKRFSKKFAWRVLRKKIAWRVLRENRTKNISTDPPKSFISWPSFHGQAAGHARLPACRRAAPTRTR